MDRDCIRTELCSLFRHHNHTTSNLSCSEFLLLSNLRSLYDVKILPSDKNLGPTMVTKFWYDMALSRLLSDEHYCENVDDVPFSEMKLKLVTILKRYGGINWREGVVIHTPSHRK